MRTRGAALLAGGLVIAGLLAKPVFHEGHPHTTLEWIGTIGGLVAAGALLVAIVVLASPWRLGFTAGGMATYGALLAAGALSQPDIDLALAKTLDARYEENEHSVRRLRAALWVALGALVVEVAGLALAAAVSS